MLSYRIIEWGKPLEMVERETPKPQGTEVLLRAKHSGVGSGTVESPSGTAIFHTTDENITATGTGWRYNRLAGHIFVNSSATDSRGAPYSTYGY